MAKKSRSLRNLKSLTRKKSPGRVGKLLALHGLVPSTKSEEYSSNELLNKIGGDDFAETEPACAIIASLFDIASEEKDSIDIEAHLQELLDGGLIEVLKRPWSNGGARRISNDELPKKTCCLMVFRSYFGYLSERSTSSTAFTDDFLSSLAQTLEEALNCLNNVDHARYHQSALRFCRMLFSCIDVAISCHPVEMASFARSYLPGKLRDVPLVTLALRIALRDITTEVKNELLLDSTLRASAAEFVADICQSLSKPEDVDSQQLQAFLRQESRSVNAPHSDSLTMRDFNVLLDRIRCALYIAGACLEWEIEGLLDDIRVFIARAIDIVMAVDEQGVLLLVRLATLVTEEAERLASSQRAGDFQDLASLLSLLDLCHTTVDVGVTLLEEESIKSRLSMSSLEAWLNKRLHGSIASVVTSLPGIQQLNPDAKQHTLHSLGSMIATIGRIVENEVPRLVQLRATEVRDIGFGPRKQRIQVALDQFCKLVRHFAVLEVVAEIDGEAMEAWETALGISFEYWYVNYQAFITDGLVEQYQEALRFLPDEAHACFSAQIPEEILTFLRIVAPSLLVKSPLVLKEARQSQLEFYRWLVLCASLLGQISPPFFPEVVKVISVELFTQILQVAIADNDEFGFRHYGISILAEAMFGIMDNLAEDGFHHLYNVMHIEDLIDKVLLLIKQQINALRSRAAKRQETDALERLEDAATNFQAFREYKANLK